MSGYLTRTQNLDRAGDAAGRAAGLVRGLDVASILKGAAAAVPGAGAATALPATGARLGGDLEAWAKGAAAHGAGLHASAAGYRETDQADAGHLRRSGGMG